MNWLLVYSKVLYVIGICIVLASIAIANQTPSIPDDMVLVEGGSYIPLYKEEGAAKQIAVEPFLIDRYQVTNAEYLVFIEAKPKWHPDHVVRAFADAGYLGQIGSGLKQAQANQPVTHVSWYAAMDYCKHRGKTLPSLNQWEFAAQASSESPRGIDSPAFKRKILDWYAQPSTRELPNVESTEKNYWGIHGMHGVVWELVSDFNSNLVTGESRADASLDRQLFCGSGASRAVDPGDYAAFMRFALRSSYSAEYTLSTMGFRCAKRI